VEKTILLDHTALESARVEADPVNAEQPQISIRFTPDGARRFAEITRQAQSRPAEDRRLAILVDGKIISAPRVMGEVPGGQAVITGHFDRREAQRLASLLQSAAHTAPAAAAADTPAIAVERIFGPETPTGPYKHPSSLAELDNGDLFLAFYTGAGEYATETKVYASRQRRGSREWSAPVVIASNPFYSMGNPVVWQAPGGVLWHFFVVRPGATWSTSRIAAKISRDRGETWSDAFVVAWEPGMMVRSRPILLADGHYLLPIYHETGSDPDRTAADTCSLFLRFDPARKTWTPSNRVGSRLGNLQPAVVELEPGRLLALCRRGGDYEPGDDGNVVQTESTDGGRTWSPGVETDFPNPNAAVELIRLRNGHLLFLYNDSPNDRTPLAAALSTDGGRTWPHRRNLVEGPGDFAYPTALQTKDGRIHVTFTSDERTVIRHAVFPESAILRIP
jgi:predicted neuraminidase